MKLTLCCLIGLALGAANINAEENKPMNTPNEVAIIKTSEGDMVVLSCFQQNKNKLSASCRKFLTEVGQLN